MTAALHAVTERINCTIAPTKLRQLVENCRNHLVTVLEPNFGLVEELVSCGALTGEEREEVLANRTRSKRNRKLLDYILAKSDDDGKVCRRLLEALDATDQRHVVNFILQDNDSASDERPLTDEERCRLDTNLPQLMRLLEADELCAELLSDDVLGQLQYEHIREQATRRDKNSELIEILVRRSFADYQRFLRALHRTKQGHVAEILDSGGVVMRATAHIKEPDSSEESKIVTEIRELLNQCTEEELSRVEELVLLKRQGIRVIGASDGSVDVLFWCVQRPGLVRLHEWLLNGRIRDIVKSLMNRVMKRTPPLPRIGIDLDWNEDEYDQCVKYFKKFRPEETKKRPLPQTVESSPSKTLAAGSREHPAQRRDDITSGSGVEESYDTEAHQHLAVDCSDINQLEDIVRESYLLKAIVLMYRKLIAEKTRPEAEVISTICSVTFHWWHLLYRRPAFTRKVRKAIRDCCKPYRRHWTRLARLETFTEGGSRVRGVAYLNSHIYVIYSGCNQMAVYSGKAPFKPIKNIELSHARFPLDMVAHPAERCLYVADWAGGGERGGRVWKVYPDIPYVARQPFLEDIEKPRKLSLTEDRLLIIGADRLKVYRLPNNALASEVVLPAADAVVEAQHAVEMGPGTTAGSRGTTYVVGHGESGDVPHRVSTVHVTGSGGDSSQVAVLRAYGAEGRGSLPGQLSWPAHVSLGAGDGRVILADCDNDRVLLLDRRLRLERVLLTRDDDDIEKPRRLCYVDHAGLLLVGIDFGYVDVYRVLL